MLKFLVLFCLLTLSSGYTTRTVTTRNSGDSDKSSSQSSTKELQQEPGPQQQTIQQEGSPAAAKEGDPLEGQQWQTPEFKVKQKPAKGEQQPQPAPGGKKQASTRTSNPPPKTTETKKSSVASEKPKSTTTTTKTKQDPAAKKSTTTRQSSEKKGKKSQPASQKVETKGSPETAGSKDDKASLARRRSVAKKGLLSGGGGQGKRESGKGEEGKKDEKGEDIIPKSQTEYNDLVHPVPSASVAKHFFDEVAKPMPKSKGCEDSYDGELPKIIIPHHYDLALKLDVKNMKFWGHELIYVEVNVSKLETFYLHSHELEIAEVLYIDSQEQKPIIGKIANVDPKEKLVTIALDSPQETKNGFISVKWKGTVSETLEGIYKTNAINMEDPDNAVSYQAISTQFEPASARKAFPCIDEPAVKATYNQTVITQAENAALANGIEEKEEVLPEDQDGVKWKKVTFGRTPKMSTFLVAFFAGEFEYIETKSKNNGVRIRLYMAKGKKKDGEYALNEAVESLDYLEKHFEIEFPMPKIDMTAIPDYAQGAMENWGLITFRESMVLIPEGEMLQAKMQLCKMIVTHELVHQWFGNLVTHRWWKYLWLKEGFAQYMQHFITDKLKPEWKVLNTFTTVDYMSAISGDASVDSHAIEVDVKNVGDVGEIFDDVSYAKGASLLRWVMDWLGEETMKKGYNKYLSDNKFGTACSSDLWDALEWASGKPVAKVMTGWVKSKGYPMVSAMILNKNSTSLTLKMIQKRFSLTPSGIESKGDIWSFPMKFITSREDESSGVKAETTKSEFMFDKKSYTVTVPMDGPTALDWVKINPGLVGFYIVKYLEPLAFRLVDPIMEQSLGYIDRVSLINDMFQQVLAGERSIIEYLNFVKAYREDPNFYVWQTIDGQMAKLSLLSSNTNFASSFFVFVHYLYGPIYEKIPSWEPIQGEGGNEAALKALVIKRLGIAGYKPVVEKARQYFDDENSGKKKMPKTLKSIILSLVTRRMNDTEFKDRIRQFVDTDDEGEKSKIQFSLIHAQDESQIKAVVKLTFSKYVRSMDTLVLLGGVASASLKGRTLVWRFFVQNAAEFKKRFDGGMAKFLKGLLSGFASKSVLDKMRENLDQIVREHNIEGTEMAVKQGYDFGMANYNILLRGGQEMSSFLTEFADLYTA